MSSTNGSTADDFVPNDLIRGRYKLEQRLAKGGMGTVYRAKDTTLSRPVAVKLLHAVKDTDDPERLVERFKREAESLARLNHRNIVTVFDYGPTEDGGYFLAMEFVDGRSLSELAKTEQIEPQRAIKLVLQIGRALRYAHKQGIVHRDVKPGNVLVGRTDDGEVAKLVDFGLVRMQKDERLTAHGLILGSVHCMAPEQIKGMEVDARTDIYALGIVLFRLLIGQYPYHSGQATEVMAAHLHAPVPKFRDVKPDLVVPPGLEGVVRKCLEKAPDDRYQNAADLVQDLRDCLEVPPSEFVSVTMVDDDSVVKKITGGNQRSWVVLLIVALVGLVLAGGAIVGVTLAVGTASLSGAGGGGDGSTAGLTTDGGGEAGEVTAQPKPGDAAAEVDGAGKTDGGEEAGGGAPADDGEEAEAPKEVVKEAPAPAPVKPNPVPKPPPAPKVAPAPEPDPQDAVAAVEEPAPQPQPAAPSAAVTLNEIVAVPSGESITITLKMSNDKVRALSFAAEDESAEFPKRFQIQFRGGASDVGKSTVSVGHALVDNVSIVEKSGTLVVLVNSRSSPRMVFSQSGSDYSVKVSP